MFTPEQLSQINVPSFLKKLRLMIDDSEAQKHVYWSKNGKSFIIKESIEFSTHLLPVYFKHKNLSSFIRQLNMYGFRKIITADAESLRTGSSLMTFSHPSFVKDEIHLMANIKRKMTSVRSTVSTNELSKVLSEIEALKNQNMTLASTVNRIQSENKMLFDGYTSLRHKLRTQVEVTDKLFKFLVRITMQHSRNNRRKMQPFSLPRNKSSVVTDKEELCASYKVKGRSSRAVEGPTIQGVTNINYGNVPNTLGNVGNDKSFLINVRSEPTVEPDPTSVLMKNDDSLEMMEEDIPGLKENTNQVLMPYHRDFTPDDSCPAGHSARRTLLSIFDGEQSSSSGINDMLDNILTNEHSLPQNFNTTSNFTEKTDSVVDIINNASATNETTQPQNISGDNSGKTGRPVLVDKSGNEVISVGLARIPVNRSVSNADQPSTPGTDTSLQPYQGVLKNDLLLSSSSSMPTATVSSNLGYTSPQHINSQIEELKSHLNSLEDYFSTGDVDIDAESLSSLLTIFSEDDMRFPKSKTAGNVVSLYNQPMADAYSDDKKAKKLKKLDLQAAAEGDSINSVLDTPRVSFDDHSDIFKN